MSARILIVSTNREFAPQPAVPIGAAWVAESLRLAGFEVQFLDLCFQKEPAKVLDRMLDTFRPDGIGLSVRNLDNCDFLSPVSFLPEVKRLVGFIKQRSDARILLGGAGVSIMPLQVLEYLDLEFAVVGEGERAAVQFFRNDAPQRGAFVPGVVSRGAVRACSPRQDADFIAPQMHRWVDARPYLRLEPALPVQGKRGCAKRCLYCTYQRIEGGAWRVREPAAVVEEIAAAMRHSGAREFEFVDSVFNEPPGYLEALLEEILKSGLKAKFSASSLSPARLTREQVQLMERAGLASLVVTPESASDPVLTSLGKDFDAGEVHRAAELLSSSGIRALWCFLFGGPGEDDATLATTTRFIDRSLPRKDGVFVTTGIRIYPGTGLHEAAIREGMVSVEENLLMPTFYFSPNLTPDRVRNAVLKGISSSSCILLSETRAAPLKVFRRLGTMLGLPTPFWRYAGFAGRVLRKGQPKKLC